MHAHAALNRIYRLVWSALHQTWVVASELARGRGKSNATSLISAALLVSLSGLSGGAGAAPQGGQVVSGSGSISASGSAGQSTTTITQASDKLSINWQSFNVGKSETVNFVQPSASALAVNRIFDTQGSLILGRINANGQVWLINPNGVLFGKDAQINVGGLLASTLNPDDASIGSARSNFSGSSTAGVVNLGSINTAQGGYVALLGHSVSNQGSISAPGGTVAMGAGSAVSLNFAGSKLLGLEVTSNQVNALAENGGLIQADGGQVLLSAGARESLLASVVNNTGIIQARTVQEQDGKIILLGGMAAGTTNVKGTLDASAPSGGNGGFIETSAYTLNVSDSASITTASAQGMQGEWLLDPFDFYVKSSGGNITGAALGTALGNNNVTIQTVAAANPTVTGATASGSYTNGLGDIYVNDTVSWSANYTLTLNAHNSIYLNSAITATGASGKLALLYGQASTTGGSANYFVNAPVSLQAGANFSTKLGTSTTGSNALKNYTVITLLGNAGDQSNDNTNTTTNSLQGLGHSSRLKGNYVLGADINASSTSSWNLTDGSYSGFAPIGDFSTGNGTTIFFGTFDGLGHSISGLTINRPSTNFVGLFGSMANGAVKNVGVTSASVIGATNVGALVGFNQSATSNSYSTGSVIGSTSSIGGLVGGSGGFGTISNSYSAVNVSGTGNLIGGLVGINYGTVTNSYATGSVSGSGGVKGGLVGRNVASVADNGTITASTISNSYATGAVSGSYNIGGLVGEVQRAERTVSGKLFVARGTVSNSYATGAVSATGGDAGGLIGLSRGMVSNSYATGSVSGTGKVGGLAGYSGYGSFSNSYATGLVSGFQAGGLVGYMDNSGAISSSYATGSVTGIGSTGGLLGFLASGTISNTYAIGPVSGGTNRGGLIGQINASGGYSVSNSYATGAVTSGTAAGGLVGFLTAGSTGSISNSFFDTGTTGQTQGVGAGAQASDGVTGLSSSDMKKSASFTGFGSSTWFTYDGYTNPLLRTFLTALSVTYTVSGSKTYDGTTACVNGITCSYTTGPLTSGKSVYGSFALSSKNVGTVNGVVSGLYSDQQGYLITASTLGTADITKANATVNATPTNTAYSGETQTQTGATSGFIGSDAITVSGLASGKDANTYRSNLEVSGTDASNYSVTFTNADLVIGKADLTKVTASKTYDGSKEVTHSQMTAITGVNGESFTARAGTAAISDKNVTTADNKLTDLRGLTLTGGNDSTKTSNYNLDSGLPTAGDNNKVTIAAKSASVSGTLTNTTYSGATQTQAAATSSGFITGDAITVSGLASGKNANTYASNLAVSGADATNYSVTITNANLLIAKADAVVTANSNTALIYNGANQTVSGFTASGLQGGESASVLSGVTAATTHKNAGTYSTTASGTDGNYNLSFVNGSMVIGKAALYYNANNSSFSVGTTPSPLSGTVSGFVNNETQSTATTGMLAWTTPATSASSAGSYAINGSGLLAENYSFSQAVVNATALTLTQSTPDALLVPVVTPPPLPSGTSFVKPAPLIQTSPLFSGSADINTLPATAAGSNESNDPNVINTLGSSGMLFAQGNGVRLPATYYQSTLADPAQNP